MNCCFKLNYKCTSIPKLPNNVNRTWFPTELNIHESFKWEMNIHTWIMAIWTQLTCQNNSNQVRKGIDNISKQNNCCSDGVLSLATAIVMECLYSNLGPTINTTPAAASENEDYQTRLAVQITNIILTSQSWRPSKLEALKSSSPEALPTNNNSSLSRSS